MRVKVNMYILLDDEREVLCQFTCLLTPGRRETLECPAEPATCEIYEGLVDGRPMAMDELSIYIDRFRDEIEEAAWVKCRDLEDEAIERHAEWLRERREIEKENLHDEGWG